MGPGLALAGLWSALACAATPPTGVGALPPATIPSEMAPAASPRPDNNVIIEEIDETTVGDLNGTRVPMGNMTHGPYTLPDGTEKTGLICSIVIGPGPGVFVGLGSEVTVDGTRWRVVGIEKDGDELGSVSLKMLR